MAAQHGYGIEPVEVARDIARARWDSSHPRGRAWVDLPPEGQAYLTSIAGYAITGEVVVAVERLVREQVAREIEAVAADPGRRRPLAPDASTRTDFVNDFAWAALVARGGAS